MKTRRERLSDEELRDLLRQGDPAADGSEPTPDEFAAMRRTMLNQVDTSPTKSAWLSWSTMTVAATVTVAVIALAILLQVGPTGIVPEPGPEPTVQQPPATDPLAASPRPEEPGEPSSPSETAAEPEQPPAGTPAGQVAEAAPTEGAQPGAQPGAQQAAPQPGVAAAEPGAQLTATAPPQETPPTDRQARTVQFTAPGGTRIIWTLDPDFQLPASEPDQAARGEL